MPLNKRERKLEGQSMIIDNPHKLTTLGTPVEGKQKKYTQIT